MPHASASAQISVDLVEEHHYTVTLDRLSDITWQGNSLLKARIALPSGAVDALQSKQSAATACATLMVTPVKREKYAGLTIEVPRRVVEPGKRLLASSQCPLAQPSDTLASVDGAVFDGFEDDLSNGGVFSRSQGRVFSSDLLLMLSIWVPNLKAHSDQEPSRQLAWLLEQRDARSDGKIFSLKRPNESELGRSLAKLAGSGGGLILVGVADEVKRNVVGLANNDIEAFEELLLRAVLSTWPVVPIGRPDYLRDSNGLSVAVIRVPQSARGASYEYVESDVLAPMTRLRQRNTRSVTTSSFTSSTTTANLLSAEEQARAVFLDWENADDIGKAICGFINAQVRNGLIVLRNLPVRNRSLPGFKHVSPQQQVEDRLSKIVQQCRPRVEMPDVQLGMQDEQPMAALRVNGQQFPAALYRGHAYVTRERKLDQMPLTELLDSFLRRRGAGTSTSSELGYVYVEYAALNADQQPIVDGNAPKDYPVYDMQKKAMRWHKLPAMTPKTDGYECNLRAPIDQALTTADEHDRLKGRIVIAFDGVLASNYEVLIKDGNDNDISQTCAIHRRTRITLDVEANLQQLFQRRVSASSLALRFPDVSLSRDVMDSVMQACADVGFRVVQDAEQRQTDLMQFKGIRNHAYNDVELNVVLESQRATLKREVRFARRTDTKDTETSTLSVHVSLRGTGEDAGEQIARLHTELGRVITDRLGYQRFE